jgi:hypothetical protein
MNTTAKNVGVRFTYVLRGRGKPYLITKKEREIKESLLASE